MMFLLYFANKSGQLILQITTYTKHFSITFLQSLRKEGKGNLPNASDALQDDDIDAMYEKKLLGMHNPDTLLRTLHRNNMTFFGIRANTENHHLRWGDIQLSQDTHAGLQFLEYKTERATKTRTGSNPRNIRKVHTLLSCLSISIDKGHITLNCISLIFILY